MDTKKAVLLLCEVFFLMGKRHTYTHTHMHKHMLTTYLLSSLPPSPTFISPLTKLFKENQSTFILYKLRYYVFFGAFWNNQGWPLLKPICISNLELIALSWLLWFTPGVYIGSKSPLFTTVAQMITREETTHRYTTFIVARDFIQANLAKV